MIELQVEGATCGGCVKSIENAVSRLDGISSVSFDLETGLLKVDGTVNKEQVEEAVTLAGFEVVETKT